MKKMKKFKTKKTRLSCLYRDKKNSQYMLF